MSHDFDTIIVGAGVVGLAVARLMAETGRSVLVVDRQDGIGRETSSRNSEVIHAGIYYPKGSRKARFCTRGRRMLYAYAAERGIPHAKCGKLIIATNDDETGVLDSLQERGRANDVEGLHLIGREAVARLEPDVTAVAALVSPETGVVDSHAFMLALQGDASNAGAEFIFHAPVTGGAVLDGGGYALHIGGIHDTTVSCRELIVSAGLGTNPFLEAVSGLSPRAIRPMYFAKGHYFRLAGRSPFQRLVYPVPVKGGLGTHVTVDLGKQARFGPDVCWIDGIDYQFDESRRDAFFQSIRRWYPAIRLDALVPDYTGIRPKLVPAGQPDGDFEIDGVDRHGHEGLVVLYGIESPGLTSSLAIAEATFGLMEPAARAAE